MNYLNYKPAKLHTQKVWYVQYSVVHPVTQQWVVKRVKLNRIACKKERRSYGKNLVAKINMDLAKGWNPFDIDTMASTITFADAVDKYLRFVGRELRPRTLVTYRSYLEKLNYWIDYHSGYPQPVKITDIDKPAAVHYLQYLENQNQLSATAYNNNLRGLAAFGNWLMQRNYIKQNPFGGYKSKRQRPKKRLKLSPEQRALCKAYFAETLPAMWVICLLAYHALIRPGEIRQLRVRDVQLGMRLIFVPAVIAKNGRDRVATLSPELFQALGEYLKTNKYRPTDYLFTTNGEPGSVPIGNNWIRNQWSYFRNHHSLPTAIKFYSLRDTGITEMLRNGVSSVDVMNQADHHSLEITTIYAKEVTPQTIPSIQNNDIIF